MKLHRIVVAFYAMYALMVCLGYILIDYPPVSFYTLNIVFIYVASLAIGAWFGYYNFSNSWRFAIKLNYNKVLLFMVVVGTVFTAILWVINIQFYGSIEYILLNSFTIRSNTIGVSESIFPVYFTYPSSVIYPGFVVSLVMYEQRRLSRYIYAAVWLFLVIVLVDLLTFGRIGILYSIFAVIGYFIVFRKKILTVRNLMVIAVLFVILMLPRLIRGSFDNMEGTMSAYLPFINFDISPVFYSFLSVYIYYFSSVFALDNYLSFSIDPHTLGQRTFTAPFNMVSKIFGFDRINTIDPMVNIPFEYNIYTFIKDVYSDFSIAGVILVPLLAGYFFARFFRGNSIADNAAKIYVLGWLFYTPLFNAFSFGGFLIGFLVLICLTWFGSKDEGFNSNSKL